MLNSGLQLAYDTPYDLSQFLAEDELTLPKLKVFVRGCVERTIRQPFCMEREVKKTRFDQRKKAFNSSGQFSQIMGYAYQPPLGFDLL